MSLLELLDEREKTYNEYTNKITAILDNVVKGACLFTNRKPELAELEEVSPLDFKDGNKVVFLSIKVLLEDHELVDLTAKLGQMNEMFGLEDKELPSITREQADRLGLSHIISVSIPIDFAEKATVEEVVEFFREAQHKHEEGDSSYFVSLGQEEDEILPGDMATALHEKKGRTLH